MDVSMFKINNYHFLVNNLGYYLKTKFKEDFEEVLNWNQGDILFSGIIKNSELLHFKLGSSWFKKRFSQLHNALNSKKTMWFDIENLDLKNCLHISEVKIGGDIPDTYELL